MGNDIADKIKTELNAKKELYLRVKVRPGASKSAIKEVMDDDTIKIDIAAQPVKGKANQELIKFLAKTVNLKPANISIISGKQDKLKLIKINI